MVNLAGNVGYANIATQASVGGKGGLWTMGGKIRVIFRSHAIRRIFQHRITTAEVLHVLETGETIEDYPEDIPYPSRLIWGWSGSRPLHVVVAYNAHAHEMIVITVYEPDPEIWSPGFRQRRRL